MPYYCNSIIAHWHYKFNIFFFLFERARSIHIACSDRTPLEMKEEKERDFHEFEFSSLLIQNHNVAATALHII